MKLSSIFLISLVCICDSNTVTKNEIVTEDGTVKVVTEEWEVEEKRFDKHRGHSRGDTNIIVMTYDNQDSVNPESEPESAVSQSHSIKPKTVPLNRLYNDKLADYDYSIDKQEQTNLAQGGYKFDKTIGRVVPKREDFAECSHLVPITKVVHPTCNCHVVIINSANVRQYLSFGFKEMGIIGYGVLEKGKCGANVQVRHIHLNNADCKQVLHFQTPSDAEYGSYKKLGYVDSAAPDMWVWSENVNFTPQPRPVTIEQTRSLLTRSYNDKLVDYDYSIARQEVAGYKFDGILGRIAAKQSDFPECSELVQITRVVHDTCFCHVLIVNSASVRQYISYGFKDLGVIGYGVLEKGKCGANVQVRHIHFNNANCALVAHFQTISDAQYDSHKKLGYVDSAAPTFYIWEA